jgi:hypothetical protein
MSQNFPAALNTGSSLQNGRATSDVIPASDHNDLANAEIQVETKLGYGASVPTTVGHVLKVTAAGQTAWGAGSGGGVANAPYFNVKDYGALGNGSQDDTTFIQAAINAALATNQGTATVYFPAGTYKITAALVCTSATGSAGGYGVILRGDGHRATRIFKNSSFGVAVTFNGNGGPAGNNTQFGGMIDITIDGNATTGGLMQTNSAQQMFFRGCSFVGSNDWAWDLHTMQDSYFLQCTFNNCGSTTKRVIEIYGDANGTSNMLWFEQIRVETFLLGAVGITRGAGATGGGNNGFFWSQCKFENFPTVRGDLFFADGYTQQLIMDQIFFSIGQYASGYSTSANAIVFGDGTTGSGLNQATFTNIFFNAAPTANIGNSVLNINGHANMNGPVTIDNIYSINAMNTATLIVNSATNLELKIGQLSRNGGALVSGDGTGHQISAGTGTLNGSGTVTITTGRVRSASRIFLTRTAAGSGVLRVGTITNGTSFVVNSSDGADAGTFNWWITD